MNSFLSMNPMLLILAGSVFFLLSFFSMRAGLMLMVLSMLFSPEISIGAVGVRTVTLRMEDGLIPILILSWLAQNVVNRQTIFQDTPLNTPIFSLLLLMLISTLRGMGAGQVEGLAAFFDKRKPAWARELPQGWMQQIWQEAGW